MSDSAAHNPRRLAAPPPRLFGRSDRSEADRRYVLDGSWYGVRHLGEFLSAITIRVQSHFHRSILTRFLSESASALANHCGLSQATPSVQRAFLSVRKHFTRDSDRLGSEEKVHMRSPPLTLGFAVLYRARLRRSGLRARRSRTKAKASASASARSDSGNPPRFARPHARHTMGRFGFSIPEESDDDHLETLTIPIPIPTSPRFVPDPPLSTAIPTARADLPPTQLAARHGGSPPASRAIPSRQAWLSRSGRGRRPLGCCLAGATRAGAQPRAPAPKSPSSRRQSVSYRVSRS